MKSLVVYIDTREKKNEHIINWFDKNKIKYQKKSLSNGDYSFYLPKNEKLGIDRNISFEDEIMIERKAGLNELSGNLTGGRARFKEELATFSGKKYLMIENANYSDIYTGNYKTKFNRKSYLASMHIFNHFYNLQIMFMPDPTYSAAYIYGMFFYYLNLRI